ncbi:MULTISPECIES: capsular biosynthesis protein [Brevundimonas]|uniref:capsular biosynthesis protein n=1 Tax=Brevundimonas sp. 357 TaxID=2555782 RepID=UPI000F796E41|nr:MULTISPECIES: capsular biosynthesis protein [Brevundimonas]RSB42180.1 capsular biosynthesis protein [Brevundimonas sp. 357]
MLAPFDPDFPVSDVGVVSLTGRRFLIVSAPFGPFGRRLAGAIEARGGEVRRMLFNAGDVADWRRAGGVAYRESADSWAVHVTRLAAEFTDILVFGEGGPYNQGVLSQAQHLPARVWVLENGYFRPDWITLERNGVNGSSGLPRSAAGYPPPPPEIPVSHPVGKILPHHVINISRYHAVQPFGRLSFPRHRHHYTVSPLQQCLGHVRRYLSLTFSLSGDRAAERLSLKGSFFIACLQRDGDAQLLRYSDIHDNLSFLDRVMDSFARSAPSEARLLVKNHPLDAGVINLNRATGELAAKYGLSGRVDFIDGGNLAQLCRASKGMVVNNSSAALSALGFGTPVKVLGQAFFDFEGLTDQKSLDAFWGAPEPADRALFAAFRAYVIGRTQINGNYHEPRALGATAERVADALGRRLNDDVRGVA